MSEPTTHSTPPGIKPWQFGLLLALLIFASFPQVVLGLESFVARDFGFFAYPLAWFQRECFWHAQLPVWDPYNNCGVPFLAQWNTMPLYPPSLLYLTLPLQWSLSFFSVLHLWWAGLGMYFLARRWTGNSFAAAFAGTAFAFNGFTLNLLMWPSHIATFSWMPWVVLAAERAWREGGKQIPLAAFAGALQMLAGGPETIALTWLMVSALWLLQLVSRADGLKLNKPDAGPMLWRLPLVVLLVISLSAAQLLPFLDLVAHAQREAGYTDLRWSMPGAGFANFLVPMAFGNTVTEGIFFQHGQYWTSSYYLGLGTLWLGWLALFCVRDRRVWLLAAAAGMALLCALGDHTPFYPFMRRLIPELSFITYPIKYVMVVAFAFPLLAGFALANLKSQISNLKFHVTGAILLALLAAVILWTQLAPLPGDDTHAALLNGLSRSAFLILTGAVLISNFKFQISNRAWLPPLALIFVAWLDVFTHEPRQNPTVPPNVYAPNLARLRLAMNPQPELGGSRAMLSPAAALELTRFAASDAKNNFLAKRMGYCADVNLLDGVPKVDGFFSLAPREFDGLLSLIYSASNGQWSALEDFMGVSQMTAPGKLLDWKACPQFLPLVTAGQKPIYLDDTNALWTLGRNQFDGSKTVFLPPEEKSLVTVSNPTAATVISARFGNATVDAEVTAPAPALVVVAQTYHHNWKAEVDGARVPLLRANVAFQAVQIPAGSHKIHFFYQDRAFEIGAAISVCMWVNCFVTLLLIQRRSMPPTPPGPDDEDNYF